MAQARMLNRSVGIDERLNSMSHDAMLFYLMSVPHLDRDGLIDGRPRVLWAQVAPLQDDWRLLADAMIDEWVACGLVVRYGDGNPVLFFPGFQKNQPRMVYRREQASQHPCPPGYERTRDGLELVGESGAGHNEVATESRSGRDQVATESRSGRAEDQDQDQDQDQSEVEVEVNDDVVDLHSFSHTSLGSRKNARACVRENGAEGELRPDGSIVLTDVGVARQRLRDGQHLSAGELIFAYTEEQVRRASYEFGAQLGLAMEWVGFERWLGEQEAGTLWSFVWWCQFYADLPTEKLDRIQSLPAVIRSNLRDGVAAPLNGNQRKAVALMIDALDAVGV